MNCSSRSARIDFSTVVIGPIAYHWEHTSKCSPSCTTTSRRKAAPSQKSMSGATRSRRIAGRTVRPISRRLRRKQMKFAAAIILSGIAAFAADTDAFVFSYFMKNGEDGLYLAASTDGLKWKPLHDGKPLLHPEVGESKLMRDP